MIWNILFIHAASIFRKFFFTTSVILTNSAPILWSWFILSQKNLESPTVLKYRPYYIHTHTHTHTHTHIWLCWVFIAVLGVSQQAGAALVAMSRLLTAVASLVAELGHQASGLSSCGPRAWLLGSLRDLPRAEVEPVSPVLAGGSQPLDHQETPGLYYYSGMGRSADQEMTAMEETVCYTHFSQAEGVHHSTGDTQGSTRASQEVKGLRGEHRQKSLLWISCKRMGEAG